MDEHQGWFECRGIPRAGYAARPGVPPVAGGQDLRETRGGDVEESGRSLCDLRPRGEPRPVAELRARGSRGGARISWVEGHEQEETAPGGSADGEIAMPAVRSGCHREQGAPWFWLSFACLWTCLALVLLPKVVLGDGGMDFAEACEHVCGHLKKKQRSKNRWSAERFVPDQRVRAFCFTTRG